MLHPEWAQNYAPNSLIGSNPLAHLTPAAHGLLHLLRVSAPHSLPPSPVPAQTAYSSLKTAAYNSTK